MCAVIQILVQKIDGPALSEEEIRILQVAMYETCAEVEKLGYVRCQLTVDGKAVKPPC